MWTWLLQPKNMILVALAACLITLSGFYLWQRTTVAELTGENDRLNTAVNEQRAIIKALEANLEAARQAQARMQKIEKMTATIQESINKLKPKDLTDEERTVARDITGYFNTRLLPVSLQDRNGSAGAKVLPTTDKTNPVGTYNR